MWDFSTLDSGLRDETKTGAVRNVRVWYFSTLDSGLRDETRRYAAETAFPQNFSTLDSGLRDETNHFVLNYTAYTSAFQYPRLGSTR